MDETLIYAERNGIISEFAIGVWDNMPNDKYGWVQVKTPMPQAIKAAVEPKAQKDKAIKAAVEPKA